MPKRFLRKQILEQRERFSTADGLFRSRQAQQRFLAMPEFVSASCLALYSPVRNEVATEEIHRAARQLGKVVAYPRLTGGHGIEFLEVAELDELAPGSYGIPEPAGASAVPLGRLDLIVVPGVVFDRMGYRLGYGKGYYDRLFEKGEHRALLVGLGFEFQLVDALPVEDHDVRLDRLVTEQHVLGFGRSVEAEESTLTTTRGGGIKH